MALLHVNSTTGGTPASPYANWTDAAQTLLAAAAVAVAGDTVYVHPSHSETAAAATVAWAGTPDNPVKIVCGTPDTVSGITALQTTAIWGIGSSGASASFNGSYYVYGINFRLTGTSGSATLFLVNTDLSVCTFEQCQFYWSGNNGTMYLGPSATTSQTITLLNCTIRYGGTTNSLRMVPFVTIKGLTVVGGGATPTTMFVVGYTSGGNPGYVTVDGFDFSVLANTTKLAAFSRISFARFANVKTPSGWGTPSNLILAADVGGASQVELINYGSGDTNHQYWFENKQGRSLSESTIKVNTANASGNSTGTYSRRVQTLATAAYPNAVYRGPAITKYVVANGQQKGIFLNVAYDGASFFNAKDFWVEVTARVTANVPVTTLFSSRPSFIASNPSLTQASETWDGLTGTGPNGSSNWNTSYAYVGGIELLEDGWITVTPCFAVPSKTIFVNDSFEIEDEGAIIP